jgi:hypothetical protein
VAASLTEAKMGGLRLINDHLRHYRAKRGVLLEFGRD